MNNVINDITPPVASISNPLSGQIVSGSVTFTVLAQDDFGINNVEFFIDGETVGSASSTPYQFAWDTTTLSNDSQHTLSATVIDNANNSTIVQPILVTVTN